MTIEEFHAPLNVLLAEDDTDDRFFFDKALKELPIKTHLTIFKDGEELMNYLSNNSEGLPDVLFLDLSMPRKTGFECLIEIKENDTLKDLPVVMFSTSYSHDSSYEKNIMDVLHKIGAQDYIRKPSNFNQLKQLIHQVLIKIAEQKSIK